MSNSVKGLGIFSFSESLVLALTSLLCSLLLSLDRNFLKKIIETFENPIKALDTVSRNLHKLPLQACRDREGFGVL